MKRQRNALTTICRLPSEILIVVFERVQYEGECMWTRVMLVCHHFYHIAVSAPMLWTWVSCVWKPQAAIDMCARRSAPALLHIVTDTADHTDLWIRSKSAHLLNMDTMDLLDVSAPHLKTLTIDSDSDMILITPFLLRLVSTSLVHLQLTGTGIMLEGAPLMPALRRLDLQNTETHYSYTDLAGFLTQMPEVETLIIQNLDLLHDGPGTTMLFPVPARAVLHRLHHLYVENTPAEAGELVRFLPVPRRVFGILVRHFLYSESRGGIARDEHHVYSAWFQYWRDHAQADQHPEATITFDHASRPRAVSVISVGCVKAAQDFRQQPEAACFCAVQCVLLVGAHAMLDHVVTIRLCETDAELQGVPHEDLDGVYGVRFLPNLSTLVLEDFVTVYVGHDPSMDRVPARQAQVRSLCRLCCRLRGYSKPMTGGRSSPEVVWSSI